MGILLGESGSATIGKVAERTGQHWARQLVSKVPMSTLKQINKVLGRHFITKYGTKQGIIVLGRVVPFGIGAVIGGGANATVAALAVRAARRAFGPAPQSWPETGPEPTPESPHETPPGVVPGIVLEPEPESNPGSRPLDRLRPRPDRQAPATRARSTQECSRAAGALAGVRRPG